MAVDVILGLQWGDEGKGKIVDFLADRYQMVCRFQGGPNAGHTIKIGDKKFVLHTIPSGIFRDDIVNVIGNGVVIDPVTLCREIDQLRQADMDLQQRLCISRKAHLILPTHRYLDAAAEAAKGKAKIGSTLKGIGPTYMDKTGRNGLRIGDMMLPTFGQRYRALKEKHLGLARLYPDIEFDLAGEEERWMESIDQLRNHRLVDGAYFVNEALARGERVLAEGAQGSMLDIDFGTYPFVTSSNTIASGVCQGLGIAPQHIRDVIGITKSYATRVGSGPFPTELHDDLGEQLRVKGHEFGSTTGRPRRCGWLDLPQLKYTIMLNGVTQLVMTKLDVLDTFDHLDVATAYSIDGMHSDRVPFDLKQASIKPVNARFEGWKTDISAIRQYDALPPQARQYIQAIQDHLKVPFSMISTGPERSQLIGHVDMQVPA